MPNKTLKTLFLYNGIFVLAGSLLGPLYTIFVVSLNKGIFSISVSWATFLFSTTIFTLVMSRLKDRFVNKRILLSAGLVVRVLCWLSFIFITNMWQLILIQFFLGIGEALGTPAFDAIFAEHLDKNRHLTDYSDWKVLSNGGLVGGALVGGLIVSYFLFKILFVFFGTFFNGKIEKASS